MHGRGRATDHAFIERLWRRVKQEEIYLRPYQDGASLWIGRKEYFDFYNNQRKHQSLGYHTPAQIYFQQTSVLANKEESTKEEILRC